MRSRRFLVVQAQFSPSLGYKRLAGASFPTLLLLSVVEKTPHAPSSSHAPPAPLPPVLNTRSAKRFYTKKRVVRRCCDLPKLRSRFRREKRWLLTK